MKGYRWFMLVFALFLTLYIIAEENRPEPLDWSLSLSKEDKNPFGSYILYRQLKDVFPKAIIKSYRLPVYNQVNDFEGTNTAYFLIDPILGMSGEDVNALMNYVVTGNYVFLSAEDFSKPLLDSMKFNNDQRFDITKKDSCWVNFTNPQLKSSQNYAFKKTTLDTYLNKYDTAYSVVLGKNYRGDVNFIKIPYGDGAFFVHAAPLCFTNYFMLTGKNNEYVSTALSYLPAGINEIFWDEYYKVGPEGSTNPLRFILNNRYLKWSFRIALITMLLYVLFEMKRRQRVIPVIEPLKNTTLDFVQTVGNVYFNHHDNKNIADKKISYFLEFLRSRFFIDTNFLNSSFIETVSKKTGVQKEDINELVNIIHSVQQNEHIGDNTLLHLSLLIDNFYKKAK